MRCSESIGEGLLFVVDDVKAQVLDASGFVVIGFAERSAVHDVCNFEIVEYGDVLRWAHAAQVEILGYFCRVRSYHLD